MFVQNIQTKIAKMDFHLDLVEVKRDLLRGIKECSERGLNQSVKWLSELNFALNNVQIPVEELPQAEPQNDIDIYYMAKSYFDVKEYDRCVFFTEDCESPRVRFLHLYSQYLSIEKKRLDNMPDVENPISKNTILRELFSVVQALYNKGSLDGYGLYVYGVILKKFELHSEALEVLQKAIKGAPLHWGAWQELALLLPKKQILSSLDLPDHWMKYFFLGSAHLEQLNNDEALEIYKQLYEQGFSKSSYVKAQTALVYHNRRGR